MWFVTCMSCKRENFGVRSLKTRPHAHVTHTRPASSILGLKAPINNQQSHLVPYIIFPERKTIALFQNGNDIRSQSWRPLLKSWPLRPHVPFRLILSLAYIDSHSTRQQQSEHGQLGTKFTQSSMCKSTSSIEASCSNCRSFSKEQDQRPPWLILFMLQALLQVILYRCEVFQLELK